MIFDTKEIEKTQDELKGVSNISEIEYVSDVKLTGGKKNPLQGLIRKRVRLANILPSNNGEYKKQIETQMIKEGRDPSEDPFEPKPRPWGIRLGDSPVIEHKGEYYFEFIVTDDSTVTTFYEKFDPITETYSIISEDEIEGLPKPKPPSDESQNEIRKKVTIRCVKFENINYALLTS